MRPHTINLDLRGMRTFQTTSRGKKEHSRSVKMEYASGRAQSAPQVLIQLLHDRYTPRLETHQW